MVKYSLEAIQALLKPVAPIPGRPMFSTLYQCQQTIIDCLRKIDHHEYPNDGFSGYMMSPCAFRLYSNLPWIDPASPGQYFVKPALATSDGDIAVAKSEWEAKKAHYDTFRHVVTALREVFETIIDPAYHSAQMGRRGFGTDLPPAIFFRLQTQYGKPSLHEMDTALAPWTATSPSR